VNAEVLAQMSRLALRTGKGPVRTSALSWARPAQARPELGLKRKEGSTRAAAEDRVLTRSTWPEMTQNLHINILKHPGNWAQLALRLLCTDVSIKCLRGVRLLRGA